MEKKKNAIQKLKEMNLSKNDYDAIFQLLVDLHYEAYSAGYDEGYNVGFHDAFDRLTP